MKAILMFCAACAGILALAGGLAWANDVEFMTNIGLYGGTIPGNPAAFAMDGSGNLYMSVEGPYALYKLPSGASTWSHSNDNASGMGVVVLGDGSVLTVTQTGVEKSTDGGSTWTTLSVAPPPVNASCIHRAGSSIYVGAGNSIYRSTDGGSTWSPISSSPLPGMVASIAVSSSDVWACINSKLYKGTPVDSPTFSETAITPPAGFLAQDVTVDPADPLIIYVHGSVSGPNYLSRSADGGASWTDVTHLNADGQATMGPVVFAADHSRLWSAICYSTDGIAWTQSSPAGGSSNPNKVLLVDPANANILYASSDVCASRSADNGVTWTDLSTGIENLQVYDVAQSSVDSNIYLVASKSGLGRTTDGGALWAWVNYGSMKYSIAMAGATCYYGDNELNKSTDSGATWTGLGFGTHVGTNKIAIKGIYVDATTSDVYVAGDNSDTAGGGLYKYSGGAWSTLGSSSDVAGKAVNCIIANGGTLYAGVGDQDGIVTGGIYTSTGGGTTWSQIPALASACIWDIVFSGSSIYAAAGNLGAPGGGTMSNASVWVYDGASWTESPLAADVRQPVSAVLVDPTTPTTIYASSGNIIYRNLNSGAPGDWHVFIEERDGVDINVLQIVASGGTTSKSSSAAPSSRLRMGSSSGYYAYGGAKAIANLCPSKLECRGRDRLNIYYDLLPGSSSSEGIAVDVYLAVKVNSKYIPYTTKGLGGAFAPYVKNVPLRALSGKLATISTGGIAPNTYYLCALLVASGQPVGNSAAWLSALEEQPVEVQGGGPPPRP